MNSVSIPVFTTACYCTLYYYYYYYFDYIYQYCYMNFIVIIKIIRTAGFWLEK